MNGYYYENEWLLDSPVIEKIDSTVDFDWGRGSITTYGRDYVSIRWWGKLKAPKTELYTIYLHADDGMRLYIDHKLLIDSWNESSNEKKAYVTLSKDEFHDIKLEYKEETGNAFIRLQWSSNSFKNKLFLPLTCIMQHIFQVVHFQLRLSQVLLIILSVTLT